MTTPTIPRRQAALDETVLPDLQRSLVELIDLSLVAKQAHWNVVGPTFRPLHQQLDELVDIARLSADEVAERIATLGGTPDGRAATVVEARTFDAFPGDRLAIDAVITLVGERLEVMIERLGERIGRLAEPDPVSQGILIEATAQIEKQAWMLRAQRA